MMKIPQTANQVLPLPAQTNWEAGLNQWNN